MRLTGRRESSNVEDRRGGSSGMRMSTGKKRGFAGIIMLIIGALIWFNTGDNTMFVNNLGIGQGTTTEQTTNNTGTNKAQDELAVFASRILASTEDIWTSIFQQIGMTYQ